MFAPLNALSASIAIVDRGGRIVFVNGAWQAFARDNGHPSPDGFVGSDYFASCGSREAEPVPGDGDHGAMDILAGIRGVMSGAAREFRAEYPCHAPSQERWFLLSATPIDLADGPGVVIAHTDVTERRMSEAAAWHRANHDPLTGLPNRAVAHDRLEQTIALARRHGTRVALLFIDLDGFKGVNDTYGHAAGDLVLRETARRMRAVVRDSDTVARLAGDEFLVLAPMIGSGRSAGTLADKVRRALGRPIPLDGKAITCFASVGTAVYPRDGADANAILLAADRAMYAAKPRPLALPRPAGHATPRSRRSAVCRA